MQHSLTLKDAARWLLGEDPSDVHATASNALGDYKDNKTDDTAVLVLKFPR
jgi:predicted dehydrogenase